MIEPISIVLASDNHYAVLIAALIKSIEHNHKTSERLDFYIIDDGVSAKNRKKIQDSIDPAITRLIWRESATIIPPAIQLPADSTSFPFTAYLRIFAPYVVPEQLTKVLYLDVDMLVLEDISTLWHIDLAGKLFAAVQDIQKVVSCSWGGIPNYKELGMDADTKYFNSGLLLIDAKKWRDADITNQVISCLHEHLQFVNYADQYGLNVVLVDQWLELDPCWNWFATFEHERPYIIHFLDIKPIFKNYKSNKAFQLLFYKYLNLTEWKNYKPISGNNRVVRKVYNKLKKMSMRYLNVRVG